MKDRQELSEIELEQVAGGDTIVQVAQQAAQAGANAGHEPVDVVSPGWYPKIYDRLRWRY